MVQNKKTSITIILLFLYLFSFTSQEKHKGTDGVVGIDYDHEKRFAEYEVEDARKTQRFRLDFQTGKSISYYMKVEVIVVGDYPTPLLCFSPTDSNCNDNREQIVKNPNGKSTFIWLKREQFEKDDQELYIQVICEKEGAAYILRFSGEQSPQFEPNFVYSYYVGTNNKEMRFEINGNGETGLLVAAIEGSKVAILSADIPTSYKFDTGKILHFNVYEPTNDTITILTVKANEDEYITLSVHMINGEGISSLLEVNGPEVTGILEKGVLEEECYKVDSLDSDTYKSASLFYLTGKIHSQNAFIYFIGDKNNKYSSENITDGQIAKVIKAENKIKYVCIALPKQFYIESKYVYYTISISEPTSLKSLYKYNPPQMSGYIYRRMLPKNSIAVYSPVKLDKSRKKYNYNLYSIKGYAKMGIAKCDTYPNCEYANLNGLKIPKSTNQMTIWTTDSDLSSTIGNQKNVMVIQCLDDDNESQGFCVFETSVISKNDIIPLVLEEKFSHFVLKEEKGTFNLKLGYEVKLRRVTVDIMIFSGDVSFYVKKDENEREDRDKLSYHKYLLSNKVFFHFDPTEFSGEEINIEYTASLNSFFTIQYGYGERNANQYDEIVPSGENYLVEIDPTTQYRQKIVRIQNLRYKSGKPFLANFFSLNCGLSVTRTGEEIKFFDGYAQEVLTKGSNGYDSEYYRYSIKIVDQDLSNYNHKMCMLYVSGIESKDEYEREIIIGENLNQQIIFEEGFERVRFLYPQADSEKDLALYINVIDQAYYSVKVFLNTDEEEIRSFIVTRTQIFHIPRNDLIDICKKNELCSVIVQVELTTGKHQFTKTNPMIEITVRQILNTPSYIQKGIVKRDFVCGDTFYYLYADIGKNEAGEITLDFLRDFGNVWGKIVKKDQTFVDEEANWRGIYRMPSADWEDSLQYNKYINKLLIKAEDTQDCIEGCYLLLSVQVSQIGEYVDDWKFYPFSIVMKITPNNRAYTEIPKVVIQVDEYVIGNVDIAENERIFEFYEVWLPHDADRVDFDWQSEVAGLYINLGGIRPTTKNSDFKLLPPGKDSILSLTKKEILDRARQKKITLPYPDSIQDLSLVISIWTDKTSSAETEIYSLRVHEVNEKDNLDIIHVNADKKFMCKPHLLKEEEYSCLFMVTYDNDLNINYTPFYGHASSVSVSATTYMYASFIDRELYDEFDTNGLISATPTYETSTYNSRKEGVDYIHISQLDRTKYLFINVIVDSPQDVMLLTNMPLYNFISDDIAEFYPTGGNEQLLAVTEKQLRLQFATKNSILVNLVSLTGEAIICWENDPTNIFSLRGRGDRLTLSSGDASDKLIIKKRQAESNDTSSEKIEDPGFLFYVSYYLKEKQNFDEVSYGQSLEFAYKDTDLPVVLFSKIGNYTGSDINVAVTFKDLNTMSTGVQNDYSLFVTASILKENSVYKAKKDSELIPSVSRLVQGIYDPAIKTALVMLSREMINVYNIKQSDNPTLYLSIDSQAEGFDIPLNKFSVEVQFSKANEGVIPTEKVYYYGKLGNHSRVTYYKLKINKKKSYMRIQTSFNGPDVNFYVTDNFNTRSNMTFLEERKERGKIFITLKTDTITRDYIYIIFFKTKVNAVSFLCNYAFKYINAKSIDEFIDYKMEGGIEEIEYKEQFNEKEPNESTINCTFHKLDINKGEANITYFFKIVDAELYLTGELSDTISVTESSYFTVFARNPQDKNGLITLTAKGDFRRWTILQVIAQVQNETIVEYVAYKGKYTYREKIDNKNKNKKQEEEANPTAFFIIGGILISIVIGLIIAIIIFKIKNQELVEQVKHVSFQNTNSNSNSNTSYKKI